ncbi:MAG: hypothetical protein Q8P81_03465 [Nanoarchaeota archaeon]|nr:hypothetical protein [Nanoarchaeota archaeon]
MSNIKDIIKEEIEKFIKEQSIAPTETQPLQKTKTDAVANVNKHIRMLKLLKATVSQIKMPPEFEKMAEELQKTDSIAFFEQFLNVKTDLPVKIESLFTKPLELISAAIDEVINTAYKNAKTKIQENDLPNLTKDYAEKHKKNLKKKFGKPIPPPKIGDEKKEDGK